MNQSSRSQLLTPPWKPDPDPAEGDGGVPAPELASPPATDRWQAWDRFLEATPQSGFMQSSWWAELRVPAGYEHFGAILKDGQTVVGGAVVMKFCYQPHRCFYYIPEGPVLPRDETMAGPVFAALLQAIEERRQAEAQTVSHLRIEPRWQALPDFVSGFRATPEFMDKYREPRNTLCIDLRPAEAAILAQMKPKGRYNIRVAQRHGVSVVQDTSPQGLADFLRIYKNMAARQGIKPKSPDYFGNLLSTLKSARSGSLYFAQYQGERLATALVVYFGLRATYLFGGSLEQQRQVMAPYLLHFQIMRSAKALGLEWYDLWGVAPAGQPEHPWGDISAFKRKFGGQELQLVPTLDYVYDAAAYEGYLARQRHSGETGFRGPVPPELTPSPERRK